MPKTYTLTEAAKTLEADAKTLREWIKREGWNLGEEGKNPLKQTSKYDKRILWLTEEQIMILAKAHGRAWPPRPKPQAEAQATGIVGAVSLLRERVDSLREDHIGTTMFNRTVNAITERLDALERGYSTQMEQMTHALIALKELQDWKDAQESKPRSSRKPKASDDQTNDQVARPPLLAELVGWRNFASTHNVPTSTVQGNIEAGRLPIVQGEWKLDRQIIKGALDAQGRAQFYTLFAEKTQYFQLCPDCPHT